MNSVRGTTSSCATKAKRPATTTNWRETTAFDPAITLVENKPKNGSSFPPIWPTPSRVVRTLTCWNASVFRDKRLWRRHLSKRPGGAHVLAHSHDTVTRFTPKFPTRRTTPLTLVSYSKIKKKNQKTAAIQQGDAAALVGDDETNRAEKFTS